MLEGHRKSDYLLGNVYKYLNNKVMVSARIESDPDIQKFFQNFDMHFDPLLPVPTKYLRYQMVLLQLTIKHNHTLLATQ